MSTEKHQSNESSDYTDKEIRIRPLFIFMIICLVVTGVTFVGVGYLLKSYTHQAEQDDDLANNYSLQRQLPQGGAILQGFEEAASDLKQLRAEEDALLNHYEWADKGKGVVRIPIDQAMVRVVEQGLPAREEAAK